MSETFTKVNAVRILVVDDNLDLGQGLAEILRDEGHEVHFAESGEKALDLTGAAKFDLVIMDFRLPDMNGFEAIRGIREHQRETPVLVMSGYRLEQMFGEIAEGDVRVVRGEASADKLRIDRGDGRGITVWISPAGLAPEKLQAVAELSEKRVCVQDKTNVEQAEAFCEVVLLAVRDRLLESLADYTASPAYAAGRDLLLAVDETACGEACDVLRSMHVTGCFFKPFQMEHLLERVDAIAQTI